MAQQVRNEIFKLDPDLLTQLFCSFSPLCLFNVVNMCNMLWEIKCNRENTDFIWERYGKASLRKSHNWAEQCSGGGSTFETKI